MNPGGYQKLVTGKGEVRITIVLQTDGGVIVDGPIDDKLLALGMLSLATNIACRRCSVRASVNAPAIVLPQPQPPGGA